MKSKSLKLLFVMFICNFYGCVIDETPPPDKIVLNESAMTRHEKFRLTVVGLLEGLDGKPLSAIEVSFRSPFMSTRAFTTIDGTFRMSVLYDQNEPLYFRFQDKSRNLDWTEVVQTIPKGADPVKLRFAFEKNGAEKEGAERNGTVRLKSIEY